MKKNTKIQQWPIFEDPISRWGIWHRHKYIEYTYVYFCRKSRIGKRLSRTGSFRGNLGNHEDWAAIFRGQNLEKKSFIEMVKILVYGHHSPIK